MVFRMVAGMLLVTSIAFGTWQSRAGRGDGDWQSFGRDPGARRYSPLIQINTKNVASLLEAWAFDTGVQDLQVTPIVVDGLMYSPAGQTVPIALERRKPARPSGRSAPQRCRQPIASVTSTGPAGSTGAPRSCSPAPVIGSRASRAKNDARCRNSLRVTRKFTASDAEIWI